MIPIQTPAGNLKFGPNALEPTQKLKSYCFTVVRNDTNTWNVLKLFSKRGFEFYEYDQLGSYYSDQPKDSTLWTRTICRGGRTVRKATQIVLILCDRQFMGRYSRNGIRFKIPENLKGLVIGNMMAMEKNMEPMPTMVS
jgi:proline iminopeptidase